MNKYKLKPDQKQVSSERIPQLTVDNPISMDEAMKQHEGLIHAFIQRHGGGDLSYEDALQAGRIGLWKAIEGYDPSRGFAFSTYAWVAISRSIQRAEKEAMPSSDLGLKELTRLTYVLDLGDRIDRIQNHRALYDLVAQLPPRQRRIIEGRYGLGGLPVCRLAELGAELGLCGERVRQLQQDALARLRHPAHSIRLRSLVGKNSRADYRRALNQNVELHRKRSRLS